MDVINKRLERLAKAETEANSIKYRFKALNNGKAILSFDKPTTFTGNLAKRINQSRQSSEYRILDLHLYSMDSDGVNDNLEDWEVLKVSSTEIEIKIKFKDPL